MVGSEVLAVHVADPATASDAATALGDLATGDAPRVDPAAGEVRLAVAGPSASVQAVRRLDGRGVADNRHRAAAAQPRRRLPHPDRTHDHGGRMSTLAGVAPEPLRLTLAEALADSRVMAARRLRKTLRRPMYVVYLFVQPIILALLFRYVFGGAIDTRDVAYVDFLMPGIVVMTAIFGALTTGLRLTEDLKAGVVDRLRSLPMTRGVMLVGRTLSDLVMNVVALLAMVVVGVAVGFRPDGPAYDLALAFALVLGFAYAFSWVSAFVGLAVRDPKTAQSAGLIRVFPLTFASSAFVPTESMPGAVQAFGQPGHAGRRRDARADERAGRRARSGAGNARLARRPPARVRAAVAAGVPAGLSLGGRRARTAPASTSCSHGRYLPRMHAGRRGRG
jgi:ABC-2 type transport system permease protein/oleandomycin transport system permease protein